MITRKLKTKAHRTKKLKWEKNRLGKKSGIKRRVGRKRPRIIKKGRKILKRKKIRNNKIISKRGRSKRVGSKRKVIKRKEIKRQGTRKISNKRKNNSRLRARENNSPVAKVKNPPAPLPLRPIRFNIAYPNLQSTLITPTPVTNKKIPKSMSIIHAPYNPAGQMSTQVLALRKLGVKSSFCTYFNSNFQYPSDIPSPLKNTRSNRDLTMDFAINCADKYDVFHFHGGQTFTLNAYTDLAYLKMLNKKVVMNYWGSEVRRLSIARAKNPFVKVKVLDEKLILQLLNVISRFADAVIVPDHELYEYVKTFFDKVYLVRAAVDHKKFVPSYPVIQCKRPLVVHAPSDPSLKGTDIIVQAVNRLKSIVDFDYVQIENMKNEEALAWMARADIIVDQLKLGIYGTVSIEGMLMGKPVICYVRDDLVSKYPPGLPVVNANPNTIEQVLHNLILDPKRRHELGIKGRVYAVDHHDPEKIARQLITIYNGL
ncbi:glycosyltransferase family 4 protein [Candidatus Pristimantibacillus sp. PTI5]|uniref:glycosyltransferase family 4 protein n=1 Tax=Candidatus Pristimantibacillus sp. PTI5 TaxID=3400422 RepID=UPI003B0136A8